MENLSSNRSVSRTVTNFRFCSDDAGVPEGGKMVQKRTIQKKLFMDGFYILDDERVRQFLIVGEDEALLIDTGFEDSHVYQAVRSITDLPVQVLMTHGDRDHAGGLKDFGACRIHRGDWNLIPEGIQLEPLKEGDTFRCGDYTLEVIEIPGHTYGSVAFVDWEKKLLLPGDPSRKTGRFICSENTEIWICIWKARESFWGSWTESRLCCPVTTTVRLRRIISGKIFRTPRR